LTILVNFKIGILVRKKNLQEPLSIQVDLNRESRRVNFIIANEIVDEKENTDTQFQFSN